MRVARETLISATEGLRTIPKADQLPFPGRVLVANRGEIALRVIRSLDESGRESVAVYSDAEIDAAFTEAATHAYALDGQSAAETYMDAAKILSIAAASGADAIHPGYGFLAENADFARAALAAGLTWIGPDPTALETLGDKVQARRAALAAGVPPVPGTLDPVTSSAQVKEFTDAHGFPIVLKAADGGGGRGIHVMQGEADVAAFFEGRDLSSGAGFFIERYVQRARHVETQCGRDTHGNFNVYSSRDCSVQRRHQKMIEEAPAPFLTEETNRLLGDYSQRLFEAVGYTGLGTCEFLLTEGGDLFFLEVNPRLQVEHTVTEEVTGVDLVLEQLKIAALEPIAPAPPVRGHSIELRVTSEDPAGGLFPTTGKLTRVSWPTGPGIRIDTGVREGDQVSPDFDSMVAKIIVTAPSRDQAIKRALRVTRETTLEGIQTPLPLYRFLLSQEALSSTETLGVWTRWLEDQALDAYANHAEEDTGQTEAVATTTASQQRSRFVIELDGKRAVLTVPSGLLSTNVTGTKPLPPQPLRTGRERGRTAKSSPDSPSITSPMQAIVTRIVASPGDKVDQGDLIMVLEAMKMEKHVHSPKAGTLKSISVEVGQNVSPGQTLATLDSEDQQ